MQALIFFAVFYFVAAAGLVIFAINEGAPGLFGAAFAAALAGVLLYAMDRALVRLTEIRDILSRSQADRSPAEREDVAREPVSLPTGQPAEAGDLADLERRLAAIRDKNGR